MSSQHIAGRAAALITTVEQSFGLEGNKPLFPELMLQGALDERFVAFTGYFAQDRNWDAGALNAASTLCNELDSHLSNTLAKYAKKTLRELLERRLDMLHTEAKPRQTAFSGVGLQIPQVALAANSGSKPAVVQEVSKAPKDPALKRLWSEAHESFAQFVRVVDGHMSNFQEASDAAWKTWEVIEAFHAERKTAEMRARNREREDQKKRAAAAANEKEAAALAALAAKLRKRQLAHA